MAQEEHVLGTSSKETLPYEYQAEARANSRKRAIAELLAKQSYGPQPRAEVYGNYRVKKSPLQMGAEVYNQRLAVDGLADADLADTRLAGRYASDQSADLKKVMQTATGQPATTVPQPQALPGQVTPMMDGAPLPDTSVPGQAPDIRGAIAQAMQSRFPKVQAQGADMLKNERSNTTEIAKMLATADAAAGARFQQGGNSQAPVPKLEALPVEFMKDAAGNDFTIVRDKTGKATVSYPPKGTAVNVDARTGAKTDETADKMNMETLQNGRKDVEIAQASISSAIRATQLLNKGADAGGGGTIRQGVRKFAQGFGVDVPETGLTEELRMKLGDSVLAQARKLAPVTGNDIILLQQLLGSIDTDPNALREVNSLMVAKGLMSQDLHNAQVDRTAATSSGNKDKYGPMKIPRGQIDTMDPSLLARAYQLMKESGHDMSQYTFNGEPVNSINFNVGFVRGNGDVLGGEPRAIPGRNPAMPSRFNRVN